MPLMPSGSLGIADLTSAVFYGRISKLLDAAQASCHLGNFSEKIIAFVHQLIVAANTDAREFTYLSVLLDVPATEGNIITLFDNVKLCEHYSSNPSDS